MNDLPLISCEATQGQNQNKERKVNQKDNYWEDRRERFKINDQQLFERYQSHKKREIESNATQKQNETKNENLQKS